MPSILVPVDGSQCALHALESAVDVARKLGASLILAHVCDIARAALLSGGEAQLVAGCLEELREEGQRILDDAVAAVADRVPTTTRSAEGMAVLDFIGESRT